MSGILLGKTMGRSRELAERFASESSELADLEVRSRMAGRWRMSSMQIELRRHARRRCTGSRATTSSTATTRSRSARWSRSRRCRRACCSRCSSCCRVGLEVQTSLALFGRIFEYLDLPVDIVERPGARALSDVRGEVELQDVWFRYAPDAPWTLQRDRRGDPGRDAHRARRRDRLGQDHARVSGRAAVRATARARVHRRRGHPRHDARLAGGHGRRGLAGDLPVPRLDPREPALRQARRHRRGDRGGGEGGADPRADLRRCPRATTRSWASAATASPAARSSASRSRAPSCATRRC